MAFPRWIRSVAVPGALAGGSTGIALMFTGNFPYVGAGLIVLAAVLLGWWLIDRAEFQALWATARRWTRGSVIGVVFLVYGAIAAAAIYQAGVIALDELIGEDQISIHAQTDDPPLPVKYVVESRINIFDIKVICGSTLLRDSNVSLEGNFNVEFGKYSREFLGRGYAVCQYPFGQTDPTDAEVELILEFSVPAQAERFRIRYGVRLVRDQNYQGRWAFRFRKQARISRPP